MQRRFFVICALAFTVSTALGLKIPDSAWQKGTLADIQNEQRNGISGVQYGEYAQLHGGTYIVRHFIVETPDMRYDFVPVPDTAIRIGRGKYSYVVNTTVPFAIHKSTVYIKDADGKIGRFRIEKQTLKTPQ